MSVVTTLSVVAGNDVRVANHPEVYIPNVVVQEITPQEYLKEHAGSDFELLSRIIVCESGWKPAAQNKVSTAGGLFQFLDSTWSRTASSSWEKYNPYRNIDAGIALFKKEGTQPWKESESCWKR